MGFKLSYTIPETGVVGEHWQEMNLSYDMLRGIVIFTIGLWVNKAALDAGKSPIKVEDHPIGEGTQPQLAAAGKAFLLGYVRALPEFAGSEDVQ